MGRQSKVVNITVDTQRERLELTKNTVSPRDIEIMGTIPSRYMGLIPMESF